MSKVRLGDVVILQPKSKIKAGEGLSKGKYKFFTSSNVQSKWSMDYQYDKPALIFGTGGMPSVHYCETPFSTSTDCIVMYGNEDINLELIYQYLSANIQILKEGFHGAGLQHISKIYLLDLMIPEIAPEIEKKIVNVANKIDGLIALRKQQLSKLDELVKARFVELFGDPSNNPNSFNVVTFNDCVEYMGDIGSNGANKVVVEHLDMKDEEDYALMVRFLNFTKNDFTDDVKYVSKEAYDFFKKSQIFGGELIICKIGSAGQNYVMPYLN
ncbi:MAG: restriction endonuclease subunit S, partial [Peptococcaceae bacterium]|nr:restriction endonuclease subunit S [Peptococcaceae bacterium]